jgi:NADPH:quinone reductase-like Zn-dependent oxidoreductase
MKAVICEKYGTPEVLKIRDVSKPVQKDNEILIKVFASTVNAADCNIRGLVYVPPGLGLLVN